jgi:hypothetical protein
MSIAIIYCHQFKLSNTFVQRKLGISTETLVGIAKTLQKRSFEQCTATSSTLPPDLQPVNEVPRQSACQRKASTLFVEEAR